MVDSIEFVGSSVPLSSVLFVAVVAVVLATTAPFVVVSVDATTSGKVVIVALKEQSNVADVSINGCTEYSR